MDAVMRAMDVTAIGPEDTIADAAKLIGQNDVSALPVLDDEGQLVGIISEGDLMRLWTMAAGAPSLLSSRLAPRRGGRDRPADFNLSGALPSQAARSRGSLSDHLLYLQNRAVFSSSDASSAFAERTVPLHVWTVVAWTLSKIAFHCSNAVEKI
jgi:hypothetical protein